MPIIEFTDQDPPEILEGVRKIVEGGITLEKIEEEACKIFKNLTDREVELMCFYRQKIREILEGVVPEEKERLGDDMENLHADQRIIGWNACRQQIQSNIKKLL